MRNKLNILLITTMLLLAFVVFNINHYLLMPYGELVRAAG